MPASRAEGVDLKFICFALKEEAAPFRKIAAGKPGISVLIVGIGRQNAEKSVRGFLDSCRSRADETQIKEKLKTPHVVSYQPNLVLTCGLAGGLNPDLKIGDVVFEVQSQESRVQSRLLAAGAKPATFFCADRIATTVAEKKQLREQTGADAVEMESATIHAVCAEKKIPCATVRVISDTAHEDLPLDFNALARPDKNLDFGKLFLAIAKSPGKIPALMKLQKQTKFAAQQLAAVLEKIVSS
ncbi:MAG TPA: hypothetical protein VHG89_03575 [Verrucomicrobiae bacterium]|nr:hypothetical protein [Verrucomicrobiae bacterium]